MIDYKKGRKKNRKKRTRKLARLIIYLYMRLEGGPPPEWIMIAAREENQDCVKALIHNLEWLLSKLTQEQIARFTSSPTPEAARLAAWLEAHKAII